MNEVNTDSEQVLVPSREIDVTVIVFSSDEAGFLVIVSSAEFILPHGSS